MNQIYWNPFTSVYVNGKNKHVAKRVSYGPFTQSVSISGYNTHSLCSISVAAYAKLCVNRHWKTHHLAAKLMLTFCVNGPLGCWKKTALVLHNVLHNTLKCSYCVWKFQIGGELSQANCVNGPLPKRVLGRHHHGSHIFGLTNFITFPVFSDKRKSDKNKNWLKFPHFSSIFGKIPWLLVCSKFHHWKMFSNFSSPCGNHGLMVTVRVLISDTGTW